MFFGVMGDYIRFTGRWNITEKQAITTAPGGTIEFSFTGRMVVMHFDVETNQQPYPHLWIMLDDGAKVEVPLDQYLRIEAKEEGVHQVKVIFKSAVEMQHRWYEPLEGKVSFCGFEADKTVALPPDNRKIIEFVGDSITEGVLIDAMYNPNQNDQMNRVYQDDVTATYAWLTAENLNLRPVIMGYGAVGMTRSGQGAVPKAALAYPYCYDGVPYAGANADVIVINHGANDRRFPDAYIKEYYDFLCLTRQRNQSAIIVVLSAFYGVCEQELEAMVNQYNAEYGDKVIFIAAGSLIPKDPLHPLRDGHKVVSEHLTKALKSIL